ncbi:MAG: Flp pilus assembly protein CpaB [Candidatus Eremiobacteraeota bacterium]|nr:Flp pilus assembly protein CpaB [Candidatus Eremiobacteraeota bacterium]
MKNRRTILLAIAGILALGAGLLTFDYLSAANKPATNGPPRNVVVAVMPIPAHVPITSNMVTVVSRPSNAIEPDALGTAAETNGSVSLTSIPVGGTITSSNTSRISDVSLASRLEPGMRAVSIPVDDVKDVSGLLEPGDRVDVIAIPPRVGTAQPKASRILRDVKVLAIGGAVTVQVASPAPGQPATTAEARTATLEVTPREADLLAMADINAVLRLALRAPRERANSVETEELVFATAPPPAQGGPAPRQDPPRDPRPHPRPLSPVVVIDGDTIGGSSKNEQH